MITDDCVQDLLLVWLSSSIGVLKKLYGSHVGLQLGDFAEMKASHCMETISVRSLNHSPAGRDIH
jgi:hypothetical protein